MTTFPNSRIVPHGFAVQEARRFIASIGDANSSFYFYVGSHMSRNGAAVPEADDDVRSLVIDTYRNMIMGKKIRTSDVLPLIRNVPYVIDRAYDMFDDLDPIVYTKNYYAIVNAGAFYHVWKVLDNNQGANSTIAPNIADIDANDQLYQTADGYRWKYMYSATSTQVTNFGTGDWFPLTANASVSNAAVDGAIDVIAVQGNTTANLVYQGGQGYSNWVTGSFAAGDVRVGGNSVLYSITGNSSASVLPGYYTGCVLYIASGAGAGSYETVIDYFSNANGKFVVLKKALLAAPQNSSEYEIYPEVSIVGDGKETVKARARALVNATANAIYRVEMLARGAGYRLANAQVVANAVVGVTTNAVVRAIYGPGGGHGFDAAMELDASSVSVSVKFSNTESNTILDENLFQEVGIVNNPLFANVILNLAWSNGTPLTGELGHTLTSRFIANGSVVAVSGNNIVQGGANAIFDQQFFLNDWVYLETSDNNMHQIAQVAAVVNSTALMLSENSLWSCTDVQVYLANVSVPFVLQGAVSGNTWAVTNVASEILPGSVIIFEDSGTKASVATVQRNGVTKTFGTFVALNKYQATAVSGTFSPNEFIYQGASFASANSTAALFAADPGGGSALTLYVSNQVGLFDTVVGVQVKGANSGAVANLSSTFWGSELVFGSGDVLFKENISPVTRTANSSERFNLIALFGPSVS